MPDKYAETLIDLLIDKVRNLEPPVAESDTFGGIKADPATPADTRPVHIGSDGKLYTEASAPFDWSQNDPEDPSYVQNRPFYTKNDTVRTTLVSEHLYGNRRGSKVVTINPARAFADMIGMTLVFMYDNEPHRATIVHNTETEMYEAVFDNGVVVSQAVSDTANTTITIDGLPNRGEDFTYDVDIEEEVERVHTIPEKFIPSNIRTKHFDAVGSIDPDAITDDGFEVIDAYQTVMLKGATVTAGYPAMLNGSLIARNATSGSEPVGYIISIDETNPSNKQPIVMTQGVFKAAYSGNISVGRVKIVSDGSGKVRLATDSENGRDVFVMYANTTLKCFVGMI